MALPDFVIIGAMKCGTSTLAAQLGAQRGIFMTDPKEPNFFSDDDVHARGREWYESLFDAADPNDLKGEASTHYTKALRHPEASARMVAMLKAPKLVYLIRDPVARAVSHYIHEWTMGVMDGDIDKAFDDHPEMIDYSCYGRQLAPYVDRFGKDAVLVQSLETMKADPQGVLERVCVFLGHDGAPVWQEEMARMNASAERIRRFPLHGLLIDNPVAAALRRLLVPQALRDRIKAARQMHDRPEPSEELVARLQGIFAEDHRALMSLVDNAGELSASYPFLTHG